MFLTQTLQYFIVTVLLKNSNYTGNILILFLDLSFKSSDRAPKKLKISHHQLIWGFLR